MDDSNFTMPVVPAYQNGGGFGNFGNGDGLWLLLFLVLCGGGWGMGGFGGGMMWPMMMGGFGAGMGLDYLYPWLNNSEHISNGFRDQQTNAAISGIQSSVTSGFCDVATQLCSGFAGVNASIANGFAQSEIAANARQMADMQQNFGIQSAISNGFANTSAATADLKYTIATEACADRAAVTAGIQTVLDKLCALELDSAKREAADLRQQLNMAQLQASQTAQTAQIRDGQIASVNSLVNELRSCPIPAQPVYGSQPIFTCGGNNVGCGCNGNFVN